MLIGETELHNGAVREGDVPATTPDVGLGRLRHGSLSLVSVVAPEPLAGAPAGLGPVIAVAAADIANDDEAGPGAVLVLVTLASVAADARGKAVGHWSLSLGGLFVGSLEVIDTGAPAGTQTGDSSEVVSPSVPAGAPLPVLSSEALDVLT
mgnify:CR=1 FL=1